MEIIPAILEKTVLEFSTSLIAIAEFATRIQVDFNDGSFADFQSVKPKDIYEFLTDRADKIDFEAHLMVQKPREWLSELNNSGFKKIIVQYETEDDIRETLEEIKRLGLLAGLAIGPGTSSFEIEPFADLLDTITVMDIEPGKQGQKFMPAELAKIRELKEGNFTGEVQADGAISEENIREIFEAGADTGVVGSAIVKSDNPKESFENLLRLI